MGKTEITIGVCLMILSIVFYALTYQFPPQTLAFSPKIFPRFVSACLFIISAVMVIQGIRAVRKSSREKNPELTTDWAFLIRLFLGILIGYGYTRLLPLTGYVVATPPFIAGIMLVFNEKRWFKIVATSIITTSMLYILFRIVFRVPLPRFSLF
ncbi:MAG: tripartite tricarboxylate transporter TctB family protein [Thermodesulfobacteriota bacterium]